MQHYKFSVVIPVFNCIKYIENCLISIIDQNYNNYEIIVIDGGSIDGTVDIIKRYSKKISYWVSEPDTGQTDAINKGFKKAKGDFFSWLNADEQYMPDTFKTINSIFNRDKFDFVYGNTLMSNENGDFEYEQKHPKVSFKTYMFWYMGFIGSDAAFWTNTLHNKMGRLDENNYPELSMDREWFLRMSDFSKKSLYLDIVLSKRIERYDAATNAAPKELIAKNAMEIYKNYYKKHGYPWLLYRIIFHHISRILKKCSSRLQNNYKMNMLLHSLNDIKSK